MPLLRERIYTIEDIYALPEGERAELIDGHIYYMAPPNTMHQRISSILSRKIGNYIDSNKGKCEVFAAPFAVYLDEKTNTYVEPDVSVICDPDKLDDRGCKGLRTGSSRSFLRRAGVWIIIPSCLNTGLPV